jgi:phosphoglycolate phosphatase
VKFSAVIFDLDGTLLDTIEDISLSLNLVFERQGFPGHSLDACKKMVGDGMEVLVRRALPEGFRDDARVSGLVRDYREEYERAWRAHSRPFPGVAEMLEGLRSKGVRMAVLSNKSHPFTEIMTRELLPFPFNAVRGAAPGVPLKPDPAGALAIASALGITPQAFVFLGDTGIDMETARGAGMFPAGALWGFRDASELERAGAGVLLEKPQDLLELFA